MVVIRKSAFSFGHRFFKPGKKKYFLGVVLIFILLAITSRETSRADYEKPYSFPEPTKQIKITQILYGEETEFVVGSEIYDPSDQSVFPIIKWFYGLELQKVKKPGDTLARESYDFEVDGAPAFRYDTQEVASFVVINGNWYEVKNPSRPPI